MSRRRQAVTIKHVAAHAGVSLQTVVEPLHRQLSELESWLGLDRYNVTSRKGELMRALKKLKPR